MASNGSTSESSAVAKRKGDDADDDAVDGSATTSTTTPTTKKPRLCPNCNGERQVEEGCFGRCSSCLKAVQWIGSLLSGDDNIIATFHDRSGEDLTTPMPSDGSDDDDDDSDGDGNDDDDDDDDDDDKDDDDDDDDDVEGDEWQPSNSIDSNDDSSETSSSVLSQID